MNQSDKSQTQASRRERSRSPMGKPQRNGDKSDNKKDRSDKFGRRPSTRQVCVANVPYNMTWQELKDLFREKVGDVNFVRLFEDEEGRSKGIGIVEFAQPNGVAKALEEMHRYEINGRRLVVKEDYEVERDRQGRAIPGRYRDDMDQRQPPGMGMRRGHSPDRYGPPEGQWMDDRDFNRGPERPTYGLNEDFLDSLNIKGPLINRVFVSNIDYNVSEKKLKNVFKLAGKIENIDFMTDNNGKSRGRSVIEYEHPVEAIQAISMLNKQKLFDRVLSVELDKFDKHDQNRSFDSLPGGLKGVGRGLGACGQPLNVNYPVSNNNSFPPPNTRGIVGGLLNSPGPVPDHGNIGSNPAAGANSALSSLSQQQLLALISSGLLTGAANVGATANIAGPSNIGLGSPAVGHMPSSSGMSSLGNPIGGGGGGGGGMHMDPSKSLISTGGISGLGGVGPGIPLSSGYDAPPSNYDGVSSGFSDDNDKRRPLKDNFGFNDPGRYDTIVVRNLPHHFTWEALRDKFNEFGDVTFADIRNRGSGLVRFATSRDADRAVNLMSGTRIDGRAIDVQIYDLSR